MLLLGISILRFGPDVAEPVTLTQAMELSSFGFFQRGSVREMITFFSKTITKRTPPGQRQTVENQEYLVHVFMRSDGLCGCVTVDKEYPARVAFTLIAKLLEESFPTGRKKLPTTFTLGLSWMRPLSSTKILHKPITSCASRKILMKQKMCCIIPLKLYWREEKSWKTWWSGQES